MLQEKDAEIVSRDPGVPGLATLLDADLLLDTLRALPQFATLQALTIDYVRYKPANSCAVSLRLQFADGQQHYLFAKALTPERFLSSWHHPKRQALVAKRVPLAPVALPERAIILTYPQYDRGLPALRLLTATPDRDALFHRWLPGLSASAELTLKILRYKPERRLLALLSSNRQPYAVLRFASAGCYEAMLAGNKLGNAAGEIRLLSAPCDYHLLITEWIEGETLCPEQGGQLPKGEAYAMGSQLAGMHCREFSRTTRPPVLHDDISDAWRVLNTLRVVLPEQEAVFMSLLTALSDRIRPSSFSPVVIHGDFSVDQVVRRHADGQLQLIDWDRARLGNPAIDLASFQARIELQVIEQTVSQDVARQTIAAFHDGYCQRNGVLPPNLNDHVALALLQLAVEPFRKRSAGWPRHIAALMHRAQQLTGSGDASLQPLLDRSALAGTLRKALGLSADNTLIAAETVTSKPGRRAVLEYHWHSPLSERLFSVIGKYRHKGFEPLGYAVQRALWHGGFSGNAEVIVPQPLATLPDLHLWLQQKVTGTRMTDLLNVAHQSPDELGYRTGKALATLHGSTAAQQAVAGKKWTMTDELAVLRQRLAAAETARPEWSGRINAVARSCEQLAQLLLPSVDVFIHRDFYPAQLLVPDDAPQQIVILDFDLATTGPAALDVGNYLAHLQEQALRETGDETGFSGYEQAFIAGWQAASGRQEDGNIAIYTALALARHIGISLQFPERQRITERLLTICEGRIQALLGVREDP
ncbi:aminoglycoside phosphotransferase family protein [Erwinia endophytica]|uniref:phosphotransferase family protein n=1 Tax=Erwinia endophytica TaxID=1563158 RepID=UPI001265E995|nr:aminoglycoside phosphotransferase family protein [Erwinia endophytica]KAB8311910.1 aminoglycoside phosphotransferase family protein [Erwinia endophytica]